MALSQTSGQLVIVVERRDKEGLQDRFVRRAGAPRLRCRHDSCDRVPREVGEKLYKSV